MVHQYISLGAACNAAKMIKHAGLRRASYPFDWLLNLDDGLSAVIDIIEDDFKKVAMNRCYHVTHHPPVGKSVPAYKDYPNTFHIHSDPSSNPEDHKEMVRRFKRFRTILRSSDTLHFVYYRNLSECRRTQPQMSALEVVELMLKEANSFLEIISPLRQGKTFLLMVLECDVEHIQEADEAVRNINSDDIRISFGRTISRYDNDAALNMRWHHEWYNLIVDQTHMPIRLRARCYFKRGFRSLRKNIKLRISAVKTRVVSS